MVLRPKFFQKYFVKPGGAAERRTSVTKPIATVNLRQENIIWLETWRPIRTDCKNGTEMTSGDVATFGALPTWRMAGSEG